VTEEALMSLVRQGWLVLAVALFIGILWRTFRPGASKTMRDHALIPFQIKDEDHGAA